MHSPTLLTLCLALTSTALALPRPQGPWGAPLGFLIPIHWYRDHGIRPDEFPHPKTLLASGEDSQDLGTNNQAHELDSVDVQSVHVTTRDVPSIKEKREGEEELAGVYICEDVAWGGQCTHHRSPLGSDPTSCTPIDDGASSIGPDPGYFCIFYTNALCTPLASDGSDTLSLSFPGTGNLLTTAKGDYNDRLLSYQCFREEDGEETPELGVPPNVVPPAGQNEEEEDEKPGYSSPGDGDVSE